MSLYPPLIEYSMPAFSCNQKSARIYFGLSDFNAKSEVQAVHVTVKYQQNNANALDMNKYPAKIKVIGYDEVTPQDDAVIASTPYRYFLDLNASDLIGGKFQEDTTYKIQIRLSSDKTLANFTAVAADYFSTHVSQFSEWSTVCLIRGVSEPKLELVGFDATSWDTDESSMVTLSSVDATFSARYTPGTAAETLKNWRMRLYDSDDKLLADSGIRSYNSYDYCVTEQRGSIPIECALPYEMTNGRDYSIVIDTTSKNGYPLSIKQPFTAVAYVSDPFPGDVELTINEEEGYALVHVTGPQSVVHINVTLRRTSSRSNFKIWEDVANKTFTNDFLEWDFTDFTIESGVYYQYGIQTRDNRGRRGELKTTEQVMGEFEDAFLVEKGGSLTEALQLKLRYDFDISQASTTVGEAKVETLGSKFPFIRRNGNMYYRTFQGTGLITAYMDKASLFADEKKIYDTNATVVNKYKLDRSTLEQVVNQYDYTKERNFRQLVSEFLYDNKVKLFKSLQEGNMLVKLMNITLTPKKELGRLLYSFNATFVEVDESTVENYDKYGIQKIGTYNPNITFDETKLGQINSWIKPFAKDENIIEKIKAKYHYGEVIDDVKIDDIHLNYLRLEFESPPYLIRKAGDSIYPVDDINDTNGVDMINDKDSLTVGWLIAINGNPILIEPPNNVYELKGETVYISSGWTVVPLKDTEMTVDYVVNISESKDISKVPAVMVYKLKNCQVAKHFTLGNEGDDVANILWYRYYIDYPAYYQKLNGISTAEIDAEPGTIVYARSSVQTENVKFVVGETGLLFLDPGSGAAHPAVIESITFGGHQVDTRYLIPTYSDNVDGHELFVQRHEKQGRPQHPVVYDYYTESGKTYMYYSNQWCEATTADGGLTYDIVIGVDAIVNCYVQIVKGIY